MSAEPTPDPHNRILLIAQSPAQAADLISRIKAASSPDSPASHPSPDATIEDTVPWTISNKYYTAPVHFRVVTLAQWTPLVLDGPPAVIFVWTRGDPYATHILNISHYISQAEPEVALAVALGPSPPHPDPDDPPEGPDAFLADHGFEYIDGDRVHSPVSTSDRSHDDAEESDDVAGLARVIDALSTIMWPSMARAASSGSEKTRQHTLSQQIAMLDDGDLEELAAEGMSEEDTLAMLLADQDIPRSLMTRRGTEMAALERWLTENEDMYEREMHEGLDDSSDGGDPEHLDARERQPSADPWTVGTAPRNPSQATQQDAHGFEDDFTEFVSGPSTFPSIAVSNPPHFDDLAPSTVSPTPITSSSSGFPSAAFSTFSFPSPFLPPAQLQVPMRTGGSSIFGSDADGEDFGLGGYQSLNDANSSVDPSEFLHEGEGDPNRRPFDLTDILGTLESVKKDVQGIEDEGARRARAAKFASEFVFERMDGGVGGDKEVKG
ncbi:hypothetical protein OF83DRAFT_1080281 [Amylostereum chailletii]|nr:hypothetical protein OF83DRAFT_1080281 [Amylostereum chailletii]